MNYFIETAVLELTRQIVLGPFHRSGNCKTTTTPDMSRVVVSALAAPNIACIYLSCPSLSLSISLIPFYY